MKKIILSILFTTTIVLAWPLNKSLQKVVNTKIAQNIQNEYIEEDYIEPEYVEEEYVEKEYIEEEYIQPEYVEEEYIEPEYVEEEYKGE